MGYRRRTCAVLSGLLLAWAVAACTRADESHALAPSCPTPAGRSDDRPVVAPEAPRSNDPSRDSSEPPSARDGARTADGGMAAREGRPPSADAGAPVVGVDAASPGALPPEPPPLRPDTLRTPPKVTPEIPDAGARPLAR